MSTAPHCLVVGVGPGLGMDWVRRFTAGGYRVSMIARAKTVKGRNYENYYHPMFEVKNNKIQAVREYVDTLYAKEVIFS